MFFLFLKQIQGYIHQEWGTDTAGKRSDLLLQQVRVGRTHSWLKWYSNVLSERRPDIFAKKSPENAQLVPALIGVFLLGISVSWLFLLPGWPSFLRESRPGLSRKVQPVLAMLHVESDVFTMQVTEPAALWLDEALDKVLGLTASSYATKEDTDTVGFPGFYATRNWKNAEQQISAPLGSFRSPGFFGLGFNMIQPATFAVNF